MIGKLRNCREPSITVDAELQSPGQPYPRQLQAATEVGPRRPLLQSSSGAGLEDTLLLQVALSARVEGSSNSIGGFFQFNLVAPLIGLGDLGLPFVESPG